MNYDAALQAARMSQAELDRPSFTGLEARLAWQPSARPADSTRWLASAMAGLAALVFAVDAWISLNLGSPVVLVLGLPAAILAASAIAIHRPSFGAQLSARGAWWTFLFFGTAWALTPAETLPAAGALVAWGCGAALIAAGRDGLHRGQTQAAFDPVAFRGTLLAAIVLALINAHLLALLGATRVEALGVQGPSVAILVASAACFATVLGLARLRAWAVLCGALVSAAIIPLVALTLDPPLAPILIGSATVQLILLGRVLHAFYRGSRSVGQRREVPRLLTAVLITALLATATIVALSETYAHAIAH